MSADPVTAGHLAFAIMILPLAALLAAVIFPVALRAWDRTIGALIEARNTARLQRLQEMRKECRTPKARITRICGHAAECRVYGTDACGLTQAA